MRLGLVLLISCMAMLVLQSCRRDRKKIELLGFKGPNEVVFETEKARFHFGFHDLMEYCKGKYSSVSDSVIYGQLSDYAMTRSSMSIVIPDTFAMKWEIDSAGLHGEP